MTITEFTHGTKADETVQRFEIFTGSGRRRDWSDEEKARIVAESYSGEMSVCAVARRHGLSPAQLFNGTGNVLNNVMSGNSGDNDFNGGAGK